MVRQAVRQAHGPEQSRRTHHPKPPFESLPSRASGSHDRVERVEGQITMTKDLGVPPDADQV
jgi:hypothetical protein